MNIRLFREDQIKIEDIFKTHFSLKTKRASLDFRTNYVRDYTQLIQKIQTLTDAPEGKTIH